MSAYYLLDRVPTTIIQNSVISVDPVKLYGSNAVITMSETGCWSWKGSPASEYGTTSYEGVRWWVHRLVYTLAVGPIPDGLEIDHMCRNTKCWNPEHLDVVTKEENTLRGTYHTEDKPEKQPIVRNMPDDVWELCQRMVQFRPVDLVFEVSQLRGRSGTRRETVQRWLSRDPRVTRLEYGQYRV